MMSEVGWGLHRIDVNFCNYKQRFTILTAWGYTNRLWALGIRWRNGMCLLALLHDGLIEFWVGRVRVLWKEGDLDWWIYQTLAFIRIRLLETRCYRNLYKELFCF